MSPPQQHGRHTACNTRRAPAAHTRPLRPPPLGPRKNSHPGPAKKSPASSNKTSTKREVSVEPEDEDMAGLPQFCATCEKQIVTPLGPSILYCSESCRRKDHAKPLSHAILPPDLSPQPTTPRTSYFGEDSHHDILPMRSPTIVRPPSLAFSDDSSDSSSISDVHPSRSDCDASRYFSHYRDNSDEHSLRRGSYERAHASYSGSSAPSLSYTPASLISTAGSYMSTRPLPRRKTPFSASFSSLSVDLVTPVVTVEPLTGPSNLSHQSASLRSSASTSTAFRFAEGEISYDKKSCIPDASPSKGSLRQLFFHEAMQAPPKPAQLPASRSLEESKEEAY